MLHHDVMKAHLCWIGTYEVSLSTQGWRDLIHLEYPSWQRHIKWNSGEKSLCVCVQSRRFCSCASCMMHEGLFGRPQSFFFFFFWKGRALCSIAALQQSFNSPAYPIQTLKRALAPSLSPSLLPNTYKTQLSSGPLLSLIMQICSFNNKLALIFKVFGFEH